MMHTRLCRFKKRLAALAILSAWGCLCAAGNADLQKAADIPLPFERARALFLLLDEASGQDIAAYFAAARGLPTATRQEFIPQILRRWTAEDPEAALRACQSVTPPFEQRNYVKAVFEIWGENAPKGAFETLKTQEGAPTANLMLTGFFEGYARRNPAEAFAFIAEKRREYPRLFSNYSMHAGVVLRRWAERDPNAAMQAVLAMEKKDDDYLSPESVVQVWFAEDPRACLRAIAQAPRERQESLVYGAIRNNANFENCALMISFIRENFKGRGDWMIRNLFSSLAKEDLTQAFAMARKMQDSPGGRLALEAVFEVWAAQDFEAAMRQAQEIADAKTRNAVLRAMWQRRVEDKKLPETFPLLCGISDPVLRKQLMGDLCRSYLQQGGDIGLIMKQISTPEAQREFLVSLIRSPEGYWWGFSINDKNTARTFREWALILPSSECRKSLLTNAFRAEGMDLSDLQWIAQRLPRGEGSRLLSDVLNNPNASIKELLTAENFNLLSEGALKDQFATAMLREMAKKSPEDAIAWMSSMPPGELRDNGYRNLISSLVHSGQLEQALAAIRNPPEGMRMETYFYGQIAQKMAKQNPSEAITWAITLEDPQARKMALSGVAQEWNAKDPEGFFAQMQKIGETPETKDAIRTFVTMWGFSEPESAAAWVKANAAGDDETVRRAAGNLFSNWVSNDPMAATQWLTTLPEGAVRNQAITSMVNSQEAVKSPEGVLEWVMTITPEKGKETSRETLLQTLVSRVKEKDPAAAQELLQNPKLTQSERDAMQKALSEEAPTRQWTGRMRVF